MPRLSFWRTLVGVVVSSALLLTSAPGPAAASGSSEMTVGTYVGGPLTCLDLPLVQEHSSDPQPIQLHDAHAAVLTALPTMYLRLLIKMAKQGIKWVKTKAKQQKVQAGTRQFLMKQGTQRWAHIMAPKHNWRSVGARSRTDIALLMSRTMAQGKHTSYGRSGSARMAQMRYKGKTIVVTYSRSTGKVSNGWVK